MIREVYNVTICSKISVTSNLPRFFHVEYNYIANSTAIPYTSLYLDKTYYGFWKLWQAMTYTFVPFIILTIINLKIWCNMKASRQNVCEINSMNIASREKQDQKSFLILFTVVITFLMCNLLKFVVDIYTIRYNPTKLYDFCAKHHK